MSVAVLERTVSNADISILYTPPKQTVKRGEIWYADLGMALGSEQSGVRPVIIIQNNMGNFYAPTVIVAPISSQAKKPLPTHVKLNSTKFGLEKESTIFLEQIRTLDKSRLLSKIGEVDLETIKKVNFAILVSLEVN